MVSKRSLKSVSREFQGSFKDVLRKFQGCLKKVCISRKFHTKFQECLFCSNPSRRRACYGRKLKVICSQLKYDIRYAVLISLFFQRFSMTTLQYFAHCVFWLSSLITQTQYLEAKDKDWDDLRHKLSNSPPQKYKWFLSKPQLNLT